MTALAIVPWLAGLWLGELARRRFEQRAFKCAVWLLLLVDGVLLSLRAALAL